MPSPRLTDRELLRLNAAAVTREYNVKPRLGAFICDCVLALDEVMVWMIDYRTVSAVNG